MLRALQNTQVDQVAAQAAPIWPHWQLHWQLVSQTQLVSIACLQHHYCRCTFLNPRGFVHDLQCPVLFQTPFDSIFLCCEIRPGANLPFQMTFSLSNNFSVFPERYILLILCASHQTAIEIQRCRWNCTRGDWRHSRSFQLVWIGWTARRQVLHRAQDLSRQEGPSQDCRWVALKASTNFHSLPQFQTVPQGFQPETYLLLYGSNFDTRFEEFSSAGTTTTL